MINVLTMSADIPIHISSVKQGIYYRIIYFLWIEPQISVSKAFITVFSLFHHIILFSHTNCNPFRWCYAVDIVHLLSVLRPARIVLRQFCVAARRWPLSETCIFSFGRTTWSWPVASHSRDPWCCLGVLHRSSGRHYNRVCHAATLQGSM